MYQVLLVDTWRFGSDCSRVLWFGLVRHALFTLTWFIVRWCSSVEVGAFHLQAIFTVDTCTMGGLDSVV